MPSAHPWLADLIESRQVRALANSLRASGAAMARGSRGSSAALTAGALAVSTGQPILLVVAHLDEADDALDDLDLFSETGFNLAAARFAALEMLPGARGDASRVSPELLAERLSVVERLSAGHVTESPASSSSSAPVDVIVAPIQALMQAVPRPEALGAFSTTLRENEARPLEPLLAWLESTGYQRQDAIDQPGDFTVRGGIVDIYPVASQILMSAKADTLIASPVGAQIAPIRLDYFGDEIESIHLIDMDTMASTQRIEAIRILTANADQVQDEDHTANLLDLLPPNVVAVLHESLELSEQARGYFERLTDPRGIYDPKTIFQKLTQRPHVHINQYSATPVRALPDNREAADNRLAYEQSVPIELPLAPLPNFDTEARQAIRELAELAVDDRRRIVVMCAKAAERQRLIELLDEHTPDAAESIAVEVGYLHRGFVWEGEKGNKGTSSEAAVSSSPGPLDPSVPWSLLLVPHHELFHRFDLPGAHRRIRRLSASSASGADTGAFLDLDVGDYVVHVDHGIARFVGLKMMRPRKAGQADGQAPQEYLTLEFANNALLHVPAAQIDLVQKYVGGFEGRPPLSLLGGKRWSRQKEQVAQAVKDMAAELLRVQAARATMPGVRYPTDTAWQKEFEAEFPYDETEDQLAAIAATKNDMSRDRPMDRLICGDVGFGKTEVAIRAAFKAIEYGKQVAVLVPTTVLAEQHERTFRQRMADYPFRVESLSRFKTSGEQKATIKDLTAGRIDVVIGTHRILSKDVAFADLGLVIVDEEQRFGVEHKNKLLELRLTADVLTLTATPIPRTLHMSMIGLRDISSLSQPPADRRAIVTEVAPYDKERIKQALIRELARDGQAYFVHNRVHNIHSVAADIHQLVPQARIVVGHGQMPGHELEKVMLTFMRGEADILVCTTIIESGIDIPTANTMFINQADHFGLADLHQLRGRVGRYKNRAYCYLLLPPDRPVTDHAAKRLKAIEQYAMLGAGFKIAMRDLEIRGAGNLLGAEQSGHIAAVGYEMYCTLLERAATRLRGDQIIEPTRTHLELPNVTRAGLSLPKRYIKSDKHRMEAYRRVSHASTLEELDKVVHDLKDAYGDPPTPAQTFLDLAEIRIAASTLSIDSIKLEGPDLIFKTSQPQKLDAVFASAPGRVSLLDDTTLYFRPPANYLDPPATLLAVLRKLLVRRVGA